MFGFGGWLNRVGWQLSGPGWYDDVADELMEDHYYEIGCTGYGVDWFDEYPECYFCSWCGDLL